jgi:hypothetical protein
MEARSRWLSIINEKTIADFKRVAEQTGSSATGVLMSPRIIHIPQRQAARVDA